MDRIKINNTKTDLLLKMLTDLFYDYNYITVNRFSIVTFREKWWKFWTTKKSSVFELCSIDIPQKLMALCGFYGNLFKNSIKFNESINYLRIVSDIILQHEEIDIIKYLHQEWVKIALPVPKVEKKILERISKPIHTITFKDVIIDPIVTSKVPTRLLAMPNKEIRNIIKSLKVINSWQIKKKEPMRLTVKDVIFKIKPKVSYNLKVSLAAS
jgi:hypothetical protein